MAKKRRRKEKSGFVLYTVFSVSIVLALLIGLYYYYLNKQNSVPVVANTDIEQNQVQQVAEPEPEMVLPQYVSYLTGLEVTAEVYNQRPIAVMTGNTKEALPQYGLNSAGIIYEAPTEGGISRIMPIYENVDGLDQIGCVRSCRPYYAKFAAEFDAIYVHFGQSAQGEELLKTGIVDNISGLDSSVEKAAFYRTNDRIAPHNAFTSASGISSGAQIKGYSTTRNSAIAEHYKFSEYGTNNELLSGTDCVAMHLYYSYNDAEFVYDANSRQYTRYQLGDVQIDRNDGLPITVTNVIFQNVSSEIYPGTEYLNLGTDTSGQGKFFTSGKMVDINWRKEADGITHYYYMSGQEIELNRGRTWISLCENQRLSNNVYYSIYEEFSR